MLISHEVAGQLEDEVGVDAGQEVVRHDPAGGRPRAVDVPDGEGLGDIVETEGQKARQEPDGMGRERPEGDELAGDLVDDYPAVVVFAEDRPADAAGPEADTDKDRQGRGVGEGAVAGGQGEVQEYADKAAGRAGGDGGVTGPQARTDGDCKPPSGAALSFPVRQGSVTLKPTLRFWILPPCVSLPAMGFISPTDAVCRRPASMPCSIR